MIAGDLTDAKDGHNAHFVKRVTDAIVRLADAYKDVVVMMGNHDYIDAKTPFFEFLELRKNVFFVKEPMTFELSGVSFACFPHSSHPQLDWQKQSDTDLAIFHQTFEGALSASGEQLHGIDLGFIDRYVSPTTVCVAGDIHTPHQIGRLTYIGAPHPTAFGDSYQPRVMAYEKGVGLRSFPRFTIQKIHAQIFQVRDLDQIDIRPGDQVRVTMSLFRSEFSDWITLRPAIEEYLQKKNAICCGIELKELQSGRKKLEASASAGLQPLQVLEQYSKHQRLSQELLDVGVSLLSGVANATTVNVDPGIQELRSGTNPGVSLRRRVLSAAG